MMILYEIQGLILQTQAINCIPKMANLIINIP